MSDVVSQNRTAAQKWWALVAVCLCVLAVSLDGTVLSVALPTLGNALGASESDLEWFQSGYLLTLAAGVLPAGLVGDRFGRKKVLLVSLVIFGLGSILCAEAWSPTVFLIARLFMGLAGAGVTVMAFSALVVLFDDKQRPRAVGVYESANFLALPLGPILGGWMLSHLWWGWVFLINVPVVAIGLVVGIILIPESRSSERAPQDWVGVLLSTMGLVAVTYGLIRAGSNGWSDGVAIALIGGGVLVLVGFALWERRFAARGGRPMVDPDLLRSRSFTVPAVLSGLAGLGLIGLLFNMPQYFQAVHGVDAFGSGLRLLPLVGGLIVGALPAGWLVRRIGSKLTVTIGFVILAGAAFVGTSTRTDSTTEFVAIWMAVVCAGSGLALTAGTAAALSRLSEARSGIGSAIVQTFQKTAGPFGTAVAGSVLAGTYRANLHLGELPSSAAAAVRQSVYGGVAVANKLGSASLARDVRLAFTNGVDASLLVTACVGVAGVAIALALIPRRRPESSSAGGAIG
ncbi:MAG TPA: DHA2 family efflux MFS transporter permease subunit [Galbitalea sp.]|jgi:EmrB/QacA subfamily drug resistance transporter|nr:DHA2 family efflux MFS transporter permease subunit [Galbitalea sp.]